MASTINNTFSLATRTLAAVEHPMIKRAGLGFTLNQPFAWSLINTAAVAARMLDEHNFSAESLVSEGVRDELLASEFDTERYDQLVIKMATLRHFNRRVCGTNEIGMGTINACLKPDEATVSLEDIKNLTRDRIKIERRMGKLKPNAVAARFNELVTAMYETAVAKKRQTKRLMDEVFFLCNRSEDMLFQSQYENQLEAHTAYRDAELADYDQFDYLGDTLAEKLVEPVIRAREELQRVMDRSYRTDTQTHGTALMKELDTLATALGINFAKIDAQNAAIDAEIAQAEISEAAADAEIDKLDCVLPELDVEQPPVSRERRVIKSEARQQREAEETAAAQQRAEYEAKNAARTAKAAATRAAKAAAQAHAA